MSTEQQIDSKLASDVMTLDEILDAQGVEYDSVPAWGKHVGIGSITAGEVLEWIEEKDGPRKREAGLLLLARSLVGPDLTRVCKTKDDENRMVESLKGKDSRTCNKIVERIIKLNGIMGSAGEEAKNASGAVG